jgi:ankyrin repeat domain-containing protein 50
LLKTLLLLLSDHLLRKRLYLIINAVDESDDKDKHDILNLLFDLCLNIKYYVVKAFITSWPALLLKRSISKFHNIITLQDKTKSDISHFASSFLKELEFTRFLEQAIEYIVEKAQGVFV